VPSHLIALTSESMITFSDRSWRVIGGTGLATPSSHNGHQPARIPESYEAAGPHPLPAAGALTWINPVISHLPALLQFDRSAGKSVKPVADPCARALAKLGASPEA